MMRAIFVMWERQLKRYSRTKSRVIVSIIQPVLFLVAFGFGFGPTFAKAGGGDYMFFLAPGIIAMTILFSSTMNGIETIWDKQFGFLKETLVAPVSRASIMLGKTLGGATIAMFQGVLVLLITLLLGFKLPSLWSVLGALIVMFLIAMFFTALGITIASVIDDMHAFPMVNNLLIMPLFFLSGALFPVENFPHALQIAIMFNPLRYGVDALRGLLTGTYAVVLGLDLLVVIPLILVMVWIGIKSFSKIEA